MAARSKFFPILCALGLALTLSACDKCGDFFWSRPSGPAYCKSAPAPN